MAIGIQLREALKVEGKNLDTGKDHKKGDPNNPVEGDTKEEVVEGVTIKYRWEDRTVTEGGSDWYAQGEFADSIHTDNVLTKGVNRGLFDQNLQGEIVANVRPSFSTVPPAIIYGDSNIAMLLTGDGLTYAKGSTVLQDRIVQPLMDQQVTTDTLEFKVVRTDFFKSVKARLKVDKTTKVRLVGYINALKRPEDKIYENVSAFEFNEGRGDTLDHITGEIEFSRPTYGSTGAELWFTAYTEDELVYDGTLIGGEFVPYFEESYYPVEIKPLPNEAERITTKISSTFVLSVTEQVIPFDTIVGDSSGVTVTNGVFEVTGNEGLYIGSMSSYVWESGNPTLFFWIEYCPIETGVWGLYPNSLRSEYVPSDNSNSIKLDGHMPMKKGDKIRIKCKIESTGDDAEFREQSETFTLGTIVQPGCIISIHREADLI